MPLITIQNRYLTDITWLNAIGCSFKAQNSVDIWRININANLSRLDGFRAILNLNEQARADRYFHQKDTSRFIVSRAALRVILGKYLNLTPAGVEFQIGTNKKPYIKNAGTSALFYNVSHSGSWVIIAVSDFEVGADTEFADPSFDYKDIIRENFSAAEIAHINENSSFESFFSLWTRKEALTKATGKGLDDDLKLIPCLEGTHNAESTVILSTESWLVSTFKLDEQHIASVAGNAKVASHKFWDINL